MEANSIKREFSFFCDEMQESSYNLYKIKVVTHVIWHVREMLAPHILLSVYNFTNNERNIRKKNLVKKSIYIKIKRIPN